MFALQLVEGRLFSEGLHVLGATPSASQMEQYLSAFFGDDLPLEVMRTLSLGFFTKCRLYCSDYVT